MDIAEHTEDVGEAPGFVAGWMDGWMDGGGCGRRRRDGWSVKEGEGCDVKGRW